MKITVLNKRDVVNYKPSNKSVIIRIGDTFPLNKLNHSYISESHYFFSDIDEESEYSIQKDEAVKLARFILKYINDVDEIVIHCVYGKGRSPAISYAIHSFLNRNFDDLYKYPDINMYVYNELMKALLKEL